MERLGDKELGRGRESGASSRRDVVSTPQTKCEGLPEITA